MHHRSSSWVKGHYRNGTWIAGHNRKSTYVSDYTKNSYFGYVPSSINTALGFQAFRKKEKETKKTNMLTDEYDENGFGKNWIHVHTGTRYDEYGFNKDRSIHKDTGLPTDPRGYRRSGYPGFNAVIGASDNEGEISKDEIVILMKNIIQKNKFVLNKYYNQSDWGYQRYQFFNQYVKNKINNPKVPLSALFKKICEETLGRREIVHTNNKTNETFNKNNRPREEEQKKMDTSMSDYDENGFGKNWIHVHTGTRYDEYGFNKDRSIHKDTGLPTDPRGYRRSSYPSFNSVIGTSDNGKCTPKEQKKIDILMSEYNENGFDKNWNHIYSGTKYDEYGFNWDGSIHKDTGSPTDPSGNRRSFYHNFNSDICFDRKIKDLFFQKDDLYILRKIITIPASNYKRVKHKMPVELKNYKQITGHRTTFCISLENADTYEIFDEILSEDRIQKAIAKYNYYLFAMKDKQLEELYNTMIDINDECSENKKLSLRLVDDSEEKISIYKKLEEYKEKFTEEQHDKFIKLGQDIKAIKDQVKSIGYFNEKFEEVHKKFIIRLNMIKKEFEDTKVDNEIDDLFNQLK